MRLGQVFQTHPKSRRVFFQLPQSLARPRQLGFP